jgi:hypothetical protein
VKGINQKGFCGMNTVEKPKADSQLQGMSAGPGALMGGASYKSDTMHKKPRKSPGGPGVSTKG